MIKSNNHRNDIKNSSAIEACKHSNNWNHAFHKHGKFILIEQLNNMKKDINKDSKIKPERLKTLTPFGSNLELN